MAAVLESATIFTPPELARKWRVSESKIICWILAGELAGLNLANAGSRRPRWRITIEAVADFEQRRSAAVPSKPRAPRRRRSVAVKDYF